jgi:hypothetical protein
MGCGNTGCCFYSDISSFSRVIALYRAVISAVAGRNSVMTSSNKKYI